MDSIVPIIVCVIISLQFVFFIKNWIRMREFSHIFEHDKSFNVTKDAQGFVSGISGRGNTVYKNIQDSINQYLGNNKGSVIDFQLLKDAVDRHCDAVEDDISAQTPVPLYCGLAGTMAGVIIGLFSLLWSGSLTDLLNNGNTAEAAKGVNALLSGVAWAMAASICGLLFTTINTLQFKACKLKEERGKNAFLAWMQSKLLPELPSDTSQALTQLAKNLNRFNSTFAANTGELRSTLDKVNQSYRIQSDVINAVREMDVMKMARANVTVLQELEQCTDKLEQFNEYLDSIHGYTDTIQRFNAQFAEKMNQFEVLQEIRDFFRSEIRQISQRKAEIAKSVGDVDQYLKKAMRQLGESASSNMEEISKSLVLQGEEFKKMLKEEQAMFVALSESVNRSFSEQLQQTPQIARRLEDVAKIPALLQKTTSDITATNTQIISRIDQTLARYAAGERATGNVGAAGFPAWMKWVITISASLMGIYFALHLFAEFYEIVSPFIKNL